MERKVTNVSHKHQDRQWDMRFNVQSDDYLEQLTSSIMDCYGQGKLRYILISGLEIGTRPQHDDYQVRHVHVAAIFHNPITKSAIIKNWGIIEGNGYYMVPRNRDLPYKGWRDHHTKEFSKIDKTKTIIYEAGELPQDMSDVGKKRKAERSEEEKKNTTADVIRNIKALIELGKEDEAFQLYPRNYLMYGEKLKSMISQNKKFKETPFNPHIWVYGFPGTGKTAIMALIYPNYYKKDLNNRFFDLYDDKVHTHVILEDLDHQNVDKLGVQFLKTICDEAGFPIDQKYKTPQLTKTTVIVTSNFNINEVIPEGKGVDETKMALHRRFFQMRIDMLLQLLGLRLLPKYERNMLKKRGDTNVRNLFIDWDYLQNQPTGNELKSAEDYQEIIRNAYFKYC
jgi:hypothetical protein